MGLIGFPTETQRLAIRIHTKYWQAAVGLVSCDWANPGADRRVNRMSSLSVAYLRALVSRRNLEQVRRLWSFVNVLQLHGSRPNDLLDERMQLRIHPRNAVTICPPSAV